MKSLTIHEQAQRMRAEWPNFRLVVLSDWGACWEGPVRSWEKEYTIRIWYVPGGVIGGCLVPTCQPDVYVVGERLRYFRWETRQLLPHFNMRRGTPSLCCYDAAAGDWNPSRAIADTIVYYAADWLRYYELWCVTGKWTGPETAHALIDMLLGEELESDTQSSQDRQGCETRSGLSSHGLRIATSTSFPLMAAASKGSFPPHSWQDWNNGFLREAALQTFSTSLQAHLLAA